MFSNECKTQIYSSSWRKALRMSRRLSIVTKTEKVRPFSSDRTCRLCAWLEEDAGIRGGCCGGGGGMCVCACVCMCTRAWSDFRLARVRWGDASQVSLHTLCVFSIFYSQLTCQCSRVTRQLRKKRAKQAK